MDTSRIEEVKASLHDGTPRNARLTPFTNRLVRVAAGRHPIRQGFVLSFEACDGAKGPDRTSPSDTVVEVRVAGTVGLGFESSRISCRDSHSSEDEHVRY